ncbi:NAD(P)/FAD-dependent oxidoreductase [Nonomuraea sp. NPDC048826]|uniref:NAD(P)/FAD-dependent oxidoreductase n=1 Tax=Nonomuraea sp. NPDC048826 TaxID=3364347 RepID=UPI00371E69ED
MDGPEYEEFDAVVVGGGPAGSVTGALLAKRGHRVLILEKERFPRYHIGESLIIGMMTVLEELDLIDRLAGMGFPRKVGLSLVWGRERQLWNINFSEAVGAPFDYSYHVRRAEFDHLLLIRAGELGAVVREEATVKEPLLEDGRVVGVRYAVDGEERVARARAVVDASGQARVLSRTLTPVQWQDDLRSVAYWSYWAPTRDLPEGQEGNILVERVPDGWFWAIPVDTDPSTLSIGYVTPTSRLGKDKTLRELHDADLAASKVVKTLLEGSERVSEFRTTRDWSYLAESSVGPGWLSVGDSAAFIDPLFSGGVCLAILAAHPAARAIDVALRSPDMEGRAFDGYQAGHRKLLTSFLEYVRFFYNPDRDREDYFEQAQAMTDLDARNVDARAAFVTVVTGVSALAAVFPIPDAAEEASVV